MPTKSRKNRKNTLKFVQICQKIPRTWKKFRAAYKKFRGPEKKFRGHEKNSEAMKKIPCTDSIENIAKVK